MPAAETRAARKALAGLIGFLAHGAERGIAEQDTVAGGKVALARADGACRTVQAQVVSVALRRGLIAERHCADTGRQGYISTPEGRAALKRWLCDPEHAFQDQHRRLSSRTDPDHGRMTINDSESPLAVLARLKGRDGAAFLGTDLVEAGERLRVDFTRGQLTPSVTQNWEPLRAGRTTGAAGGAGDLTEAALSARQRVEAAIAAVGPELSGVLLDVCCFLKLLTEVERERQWPARSAKLMLRTALAALARHYAVPKR
ncbi:DUF6456 domain-containing protein [Hoeflea sp. G2-23]|uniref:DUF6456 domain-containing protein n=1 Tax=Hoeflea algicola TaxID=2983763 RepID=A0ABT3Z3G5_9HYPH|nr:DUF6456 domain-containing protein [Hoeflea algicola]MCY0146307.1 DUF6456 domain-containing protein [Hoeflea algicola]